MKMYFPLVLFVLSGFGFSFAQSDTDSPGQQAQLHDRKAQELLAQKKHELAAKEFAAALHLIRAISMLKRIQVSCCFFKKTTRRQNRFCMALWTGVPT
jgi:hypothetical protein